MTEFTPSSVTKSISNTLLRIFPLRDSSNGATPSNSQEEECQSDNDGDSISSCSTCSSCVSSCPSFVDQQKPLGQYKLVKTLGIGEFGKIKLGIHTETHQKVAIKVIKKKSELAKLAKVEREIEILKSLRHPHIVKLIEVVETDAKIGIILEYASGGELFEYVLSHRSLEEDITRNLFAQLISSVKYMHVKGIAHRDLKLENMLFLDAEQTHLLVSDFGFANDDKRDLLKTSCGSPTYAAPELVFPSSKGYNGQAADIWSLGVILYCMVCGYLPFDDDPHNPESANLNQLYQYIKTSPLSFADRASLDVQDLIRHMLQPDPNNRCDIDFVIAHPWLKSHASTDLAMSTEELEQQALESIKHHLEPSGSTQPLQNGHQQHRTDRRHSHHHHQHNHDRQLGDHDNHDRQTSDHDNHDRQLGDHDNHDRQTSHHDNQQNQQPFRFLQLNHTEDHNETNESQSPILDHSLDERFLVTQQINDLGQTQGTGEHQAQQSIDDLIYSHTPSQEKSQSIGSIQEVPEDEVENLVVAQPNEQEQVDDRPKGDVSSVSSENLNTSRSMVVSDTDHLSSTHSNEASQQSGPPDESLKNGSVTLETQTGSHLNKLETKSKSIVSHGSAEQLTSTLNGHIQSESAVTNSRSHEPVSNGASVEDLVTSDTGVESKDGVSDNMGSSTGKSHQPGQKEESTDGIQQSVPTQAQPNKVSDDRSLAQNGNSTDEGQQTESARTNGETRLEEEDEVANVSHAPVGKDQQLPSDNGLSNNIHQLATTVNGQDTVAQLGDKPLDDGKTEDGPRNLADEGDRHELANGTQDQDHDSSRQGVDQQSNSENHTQTTPPPNGDERPQHPMDILPSSTPDNQESSVNGQVIGPHTQELHEDNKQMPSFQPPPPPVPMEADDANNNGQQRQRQPSLRRQKKFRPSLTEDEPLPAPARSIKKDDAPSNTDNKNSKSITGLRPGLLGKNDSTRYYSAILQGDFSNKIKDGPELQNHQSEASGNKVQNLKSTSLPLLNQSPTMDPPVLSTATSTTDLNDAIKKYNNGASLPITKKHHKRFSSILSTNNSHSAPKPKRSHSTHLPNKTHFEGDQEKKGKDSPPTTIPVARKKTMTQTVKSWIHKKKPFKKHHHNRHSSSSSLSTSSFDNLQQQDPSSPSSSLESTTMDPSSMRVLSHAQGEDLTPMQPGQLILILVRVLTALGIQVHHRSSYQLVCLRKSAHHPTKKNKTAHTVETAPIYGPPEIDQGHHVDFTVEICRSLLSDLYVVDVQMEHGDTLAFQFIKSKVLTFLHLNA
ncbi:hypothetical protein [Absidia glauca]|uniref:non-specific serine/threonine protein kinase n=1 Tax=Absidia glauca TaxID=4829 RepID=A0A163K8G4_ABSGL|nr:hypothetical protein [Absidia glauca]